MICIISGNHLPEAFWKNHFKNATIAQITEKEIEGFNLVQNEPSAFIVDDYFAPRATSRKKLHQIAKRFNGVSIFHLSPENTFGVPESSDVKYHAFSNQFLSEVERSTTIQFTGQ